jgi:hypothetical protein
MYHGALTAQYLLCIVKWRDFVYEPAFCIANSYTTDLD